MLLNLGMKKPPPVRWWLSLIIQKRLFFQALNVGFHGFVVNFAGRDQLKIRTFVIFLKSDTFRDFLGVFFAGMLAPVP